MPDWLEQARRRLETQVEGVGDLALSPAHVELLLEFARAAAHEGGDRTNAPIACYLAGLAHGRSPGRTLDEVVAAALGRATP